MAAAGFTPIQIYYSTTASAIPTAGNLLPGELGLNIADMKLYCENSSGVVTLLASAAGAFGDVVGPASSTDNAIARFDLTTGKLIQNSGVTIDDSNNLTIPGQADLRLADSDSSNWVAFQAPATIASNVTWTLPNADGTSGQVLQTNGSGTLSWATGASGDVVGPASATDNAVVRFDGTTGKLVQNSAVTIADTTGNILGGSYNKIAITAPATGATLTIADGKTLTVNNSLTLAGTDATTMTFPSSSATLAGLAIAQTFTALQTFSGSSSVAAAKLANAKEVATISATAATGTINYDVTTQSVLYYTSNATGNWTLNLRGSSGTSLDTLMSTGESITVVFLVTNGATAYYQTALNIDGSAVTPKWQGGTAPTAGNTSSIDAYTYTIIKTGSATFTVLAAQTKFA